MAPVCLVPRGPLAPRATPGFRVPRETASGARQAPLGLRAPLASATRDGKALLAPPDPLVPPPFLALTGKLSAFPAPLARRDPQDPLELGVPPQG